MRTAAPPAAGGSLLRTAAYLVVVIAGLRVASGLVVQVLAGALLAFAFLVPVRFLDRRRVPHVLSIVVVAVVALALALALVRALGTSIGDFQDQIPEYEQQLEERPGWLFEQYRQLRGGLRTAEDKGGVGVPGEPRDPGEPGGALGQAFNVSSALNLVTGAAQSAVSVLSNLFVILLITVFMLSEAGGFPRKLRLAFGDCDIAGFAEIADKVNEYLFLKTAVSLFTGCCAAVFTAVIGLDFPVLWGLVAFLFNFVPTIGSIIAAFPPLVLALVIGGWGLMAVTAVGYGVINVVFGSLLEPRLMGRRMGLSTLVVFLSLLFWGFVLGPFGMLLSIPLTMAVKIALEHSKSHHYLAVLLGPTPAAFAAG